ncbi:Polyisoprenoid-binding protein YceI [Streptomyces sp. DvalAA-14]|uniref:YceI family protein n=1 Tax=unclassified Streptomyces TaxID=2593676 RepID=UPI00081B31B5|nr:MULTISPECIES: YceI family protein [unclassified Streptomyces]MYS20125.1 polyisoprenoid-binding protein [Streptomyces sp. SID4948]SCD61435.1 Polyisoprenoid-binding protein YceI [Streptomyces sp. DvalAA-14]
MGLFSRKTAATATPAGTATTAGTPAGTPAGTATAVRTDLTHLTGDYVIDPTHSEIGFSARHAMVTTVRGRFTAYEGRLHLDGAAPSASTAELTIKVASIDTAQAGRDEHLRNGDFFAAEEFPEITFRSTGAEQVDDDTYRMHGDLTIKGVTRPVSVDLTLNGQVTDPYGAVRVGFDGSTTVTRADWGLTYNAALEGGGVLISDKVKLTFDISAIKAA